MDLLFLIFEFYTSKFCLTKNSLIDQPVILGKQNERAYECRILDNSMDHRGIEDEIKYDNIDRLLRQNI